MNDIKLSREDAAVICKMEDVCASEGIGPSHEDSTKLMQWIGTTYPDLVEEYWWFSEFYGDE